jgi:hypothetical protein
MGLTNREFSDMNSSFNEPHHTPVTGVGAWAKTMRQQSSGQPEPVTVSPAGPSQPGIVDAILDAVVVGGIWCVQHIWPLRMLNQAGKRMAELTWRARLSTMLVGAPVFAILTAPGDEPAAWPWFAGLLEGKAGELAVLVSLGIGALVGWCILPIAGVLLIITAHLAGMAIVVALIAGLCWVAYLVVMAFLAQGT